MSTRPPDVRYVIGSDEVGYGAWAGPLAVCAVAVPESWKPPVGLTDSKQLSERQRNKLYEEIKGLPCALMGVTNDVIDQVGVKNALLAAHKAAIEEMQLQFPEAVVIIDGVLRPPGLPMARCIPKADALFPVVSAASVIAKVNRDLVMWIHHNQFPYYGWDKNKGYGAEAHQRGLREHGVCALHRRSYRPIKKYLEA